MYICLEGIDGLGKSTQIELLVKWLDNCGIEVLRLFEPTESPAGKLIREMLQNPNATKNNLSKYTCTAFCSGQDYFNG